MTPSLRHRQTATRRAEKLSVSCGRIKAASSSTESTTSKSNSSSPSQITSAVRLISRGFSIQEGTSREPVLSRACRSPIRTPGLRLFPKSLVVCGSRTGIYDRFRALLAGGRVQDTAGARLAESIEALRVALGLVPASHWAIPAVLPALIFAFRISLKLPWATSIICGGALGARVPPIITACTGRSRPFSRCR